ncbi:penicillin-binding protein activator [Methylomonas sp. SURF-2]|uniref:Penicillin-binding protein activator n=1 Tax=Methylomonas subterranea TaxID=2952225 RepID=A0ABT1TFL1_9GAMM|nr:penicillin-binding protein activator [Methylomonas sp. SURF-2]MCQ8104043.1 penicillin-binding protein activator [Methylomonas sp. SURF-2]
MPRRLLACCIFAGFFLAACSTEPVKNQPRPALKPQAQRRPPNTEAVKSYGLADDRADGHLLSADTLIQAGDNLAAQKELDLIREAGLSAEQRGKFNVLAAQIALSMGDAEQAMQKLKMVRPALLAGEDKIGYYQSLAFANLLLGNVLQGVSARISLGNLLKDTRQQQANIMAIIDMLGVLPEETLQTHPQMAGELSGWMSLARILKQRNRPGVDIGGQIQQWRQNYPGHAANAEFLQAYLSAPVASAQESAGDETAPSEPSAAGMIAVLLPSSGAYAPAGKAIKAGLQAAHRLAASASPQLPLKFYDSAEDDIVSLYQQAVAEGAKQVIGPLVKEQIQALANNVYLSVPVLALNHVENVSQTHLYQFGLSPLDEAEALALKALRDGRQSALVLVPNTQQGERIGHYLANAWQKHGGTVAGMQSYDPKQHDIGAVMGRLFGTSAYPDGRQPSRALLLSANAEAARELAPQLKYQQNTDLAVYAMPTIYSGSPNPARDAELGLFGFCDIPWIFDGYVGGPLSQSALRGDLQGLSDSLSRLVALGLDAYNLLGQLDRLASAPHAGATGRLSLDNENRVTRKLVCAQFKGGVPVASGYAE